MNTHALPMECDFLFKKSFRENVTIEAYERRAFIFTFKVIQKKYFK